MSANPDSNPAGQSLSSSVYRSQVEELFHANGWEGLLEIVILSSAPDVLEVRLASNHRTAAGDVVNVYTENLNSLEQIQQECLRALRTGRPGA